VDNDIPELDLLQGDYDLGVGGEEEGVSVETDSSSEEEWFLSEAG
jgi:hypothetical protein